MKNTSDDRGAASRAPNRRGQRVTGPSRSAFTILEITIALAVLGSVLVLVAQTSVGSMRQRWRNTSRQQALELASNTLEAARAQPFEQLTPQWAADQKLPDKLGDYLSAGRLTVHVDSDPKYGPAKKVAALVEWRVDRNVPESVRLVTLIAPRWGPTPEIRHEP